MDMFHRLTSKPAFFPCLAAAIGVLAFLYLWGPRILNPTYFGWLFYGDHAVHSLGWSFFRQSPWHFPIGTNENFVFGTGINIGQTDSIPLLAIPFKLLSPLLPATFQYFGLWLLSCYVLIAYFGFLFVRELTQSNLAAICAALLCALSPALAFRFGHLSLCCHWLLLLCLYLYLRVDQGNVTSTLKVSAFSVVLCSWIHPYTWFMVAILHGAILVRFLLSGRVAWWKPVLVGFFSVGASVLSWWVIGYLSVKDRGAFGFGWYSSNLTAFWNPIETNAGFIARQPVLGGQYEGFAYLGVGVLLMLIPSLILLLKDGKSLFRKYWPLMAALLLLTVFAFGNGLHWYRNLILDLSQYYEPFNGFTAVFRSSGRFIWPLYYLLLCFSTVVLARQTTWVKRTVILCALVGIQAYDIFPVLKHCRSKMYLRDPFPGIDPAAVLLNLPQEYRVVRIIPPMVDNADGRAKYEPSSMIAIAYMATLQNRQFNSGAFARPNVAMMRDHVDQEMSTFLMGGDPTSSLYFVHKPSLAQMGNTIPSAYRCRDIPLKEFVMCVSEKGNETAVTEWIRKDHGL